MVNNIVNLVADFFNGIVVIAFAVIIGLQFYPAPEVKADTTGIAPNFDITKWKAVGPNDYIFANLSSKKMTKEDSVCLVENMYHEARSDGYAGMYAVAMVTLNRVQDERYPDTICEVIKQGPIRESWKTRQHADLPDSQRIYYPKRHRCQFSWYCDGKADTMYDTEAFYKATEISNLISEAIETDSTLVDITEGSTHYHTVAVFPDWRHDRGMMKISRIGDHLFYRWEIL